VKIVKGFFIFQKNSSINHLRIVEIICRIHFIESTNRCEEKMMKKTLGQYVVDKFSEKLAQALIASGKTFDPISYSDDGKTVWLMGTTEVIWDWETSYDILVPKHFEVCYNYADRVFVMHAHFTDFKFSISEVDKLVERVIAEI
jgi:hypothetical protein